MFCANCGKEVPDGIRFCPHCGEGIVTVLEDSAENHTESIPAIRKSVAKEEDIGEESIQPVLLYGEYTENDRKSIRSAIIMMVVGLLGAALCIGIVLYKNPNGNIWNLIKDQSLKESKIGIAKEGRSIDEQLRELIKEYSLSLYCGGVEGLESVATPISEGEKIYYKSLDGYFSGYENASFRYIEGAEQGDYIVFFSFDCMAERIDASYRTYGVVYVETDSDGYIYINELYSYYNLTTKEITDGWDDRKYNALVEYSNSQEIQDLVSDCQDVQSDDLENEEMVELLDEINKRYQEMLNDKQ